MSFIRKNKVGNIIYVQVVKNERISGAVRQKFICSLGEISKLIKKLQMMKNG